MVPPAFLVTQLWQAQESGRSAMVPIGFQSAARGAVHGEHDLVVHRRVEPGEPLQTWVEAVGARPAGDNSLVTLCYRMFDANAEVVAEQCWTTVWLGAALRADRGAGAGPLVPEAAWDRPVGTWQTEVDVDMARRYATVSGDWSPHHFDDEAARRSGAPGAFLQGLCTLALCAQAVVALAAEGRTDYLARIAVRTAKPVLLGEHLDVRLYDAGSQGLAFEAESGGAR